MFRNYIKIAFRNITRQKVYSSINISGLAIGLACCIALFLFVQYEFSFDNFQTKADRIYRVVQHNQRAHGIDYRESTPYPMAEALRLDFPQLEQVTQVFWNRNIVISYDNNRYQENHALFIEPQFLEIFDVQWINGDPNSAINDPNTVILTESLAEKYFGIEPAIGKVIRLGNKTDVKITGIIKDSPKNTHLPYTMMVSSSTLKTFLDFDYNSWNLNTSNSLCYILAPQYFSIPDFESRLPGFQTKFRTPETARKETFHLQPLKDIHFDSRYSSHYYITSKNTLWTFSAIGFFILIIACINFINLSTAQAIKRSKEVGVRKVLGSNRVQLIRQLLGESFIYTFIAFLLALLVVETFISNINHYLGNGINLSLMQNIYVGVFILGLYLLVSIFTGFYPSLFLSKFNPAEALKTKTSGNKSLYLRNGLVVTQFVISQILIVCTIIISTQMDLFRNKDLGFRKDSVLSVPMPNYDGTKGRSLKSRWLQNPAIKNVSFALGTPTANRNMLTSVTPLTSNDQSRFYVIEKPVDEEYFNIFKIPVISGQSFLPYSSENQNIKFVVNETLIKRMGIANPQDAIGNTIKAGGVGQGEIIGVVKDFHSQSLHQEIKPVLFYRHLEQYIREAEILIQPQNISETLTYIENIWNESYPEEIFEYQFLDVLLENSYQNENKTFQLFQAFTIIAIFIGCLGLLGLISFMIAQRTKEIGIRKVLGASLSGIVSLLTKDLFKWIFIAIIIAWPIAWYAMNTWLENYAYRIEIGLWIFLISGAMAFVIALLSVSFQAIRAALSNPIEALRYE